MTIEATATRAGAPFWREVIGTGALPLPTWTPPRTPPRTTGTCPDETRRVTLALPVGLDAAIDTSAAALGVSRAAVLLAAHARVLAALTGDPDVLTTVLTDGTAVPCRLDTATGSWSALVRAAAHGEGARAEFAGDAPADAGIPTVLDPDGHLSDLHGTELDAHDLGIVVNEHGIAVTGRGTAADEAALRRVAGYHLAALRALVDDPRADPATARLLDDAELRHQRDGLAGPVVALPDRRPHELIEEQVRAHPDALAAVRGTDRWTYAELDDHADRVGRELLARGLQREQVVAVVTERTLDWLAAVLGVLKAGGVYLPLEPHFPPDRIATVLDRSGARFVLTVPDSAASLDEALTRSPGAERLLIGDAYAAQPASSSPGTGLGVAVDADQAAYIYFTSGSTGLPKGAMCEHAGMLNHLLAKIEDMEVGPGRVVAQTAPQCFDISLWQLLAALLVGGTTLLVEQEAVLDVPRFLDTVLDGGVEVLQVVPSYLDVVLAHLESAPRDLGRLRRVAVTGEAVKKELVVRWFATAPGVPLVNAYGLTETSDDTNHHVMHAPPPGDRVPLGAAVRNVRIAVVDEHLARVPLGAPGEIVFSGVCVGRGYVNDPERTAAAFLDDVAIDPGRPGERVYRSGDHGRWAPDGTLEFLGRRDAQVKISGFRIEIGEIENALLRVPGVRDGAVVVADGPAGRHLVGFHTGTAHDADRVRAVLGESLPGYMVPAIVHHRAALPLTANGKIDTKALLAELTVAPVPVPAAPGAPLTASEQRVAAAWATVFGRDAATLGRHDDFFALGGTSLSAVKVALRLKREVALGDLLRHPVLADQAAMLDGGAQTADGATPLLQPLVPTTGPVLVVAFPHAGGHPVSLEPFARALDEAVPGRLRVVGAALPAHDPTAADSGLLGLDDVVDRAVAEIVALAPREVVLWGHSSGSVTAVAVARVLAGRAGAPPVRRVVVGAHLPGDAGDHRDAADAMAARSDDEALARLREMGAPGLDTLDASAAARVAAAYRADVVAAHRRLATELTGGDRLTVPLAVVVAADDPATAGRDPAAWSVLADRVEVHELPDGGHWFPRERPAATAAVVAGLLGPA